MHDTLPLGWLSAIASRKFYLPLGLLHFTLVFKGAVRNVEITGHRMFRLPKNKINIGSIDYLLT